MKQTKISYVMQDGIAFLEKQKVANICKGNKSFILIDKSTDISVTQILAVVMRYLDPNKHDVQDSLLNTVQLQMKQLKGLYQAVKFFLVKRGIPFDNIVGFGSDNCFSMMGEKSGFKKLFIDNVLSIFVMDSLPLNGCLF